MPYNDGDGATGRDGADVHSDGYRSTSIDRRDVLRAATAAGAAGLGAAGLAEPAAADDVVFIGECLEGWRDAPDGFPTVDLTVEDPSTGGDVPESPDEILVYVHGWLEAFAGGSRDQGYTLQTALRDNGYGAPVVAAYWDSNTLDWWGVQDRADEAGRRLARWLRDFAADNPGTTIRTVDHSLGARVILSALNALDGDVVLDDVALVGAAVDPDTVCMFHEFAPGIRASADAVRNYHSASDDIVCKVYATAEWTRALGCRGADCGLVLHPPEDYADVDVVDAVEAHCDYIKPDVGCVPRIVGGF